MVEAMQRDSAFKAVIALNNAGVSLLQRRLYSEAVDTMKEAIRLMRLAFFSEESSMPSTEELDRALCASYQRTSIKQPEMTDNIHLLVVSNCDSPYSVYGNLVQNRGAMCCVIIDTLEFFTRNDHENLPETESSILLYNYGIVNRCAAQSTTTHWTDTVRSGINETAYHIFELAESVATRLMPSSDLINPPSEVLLMNMLIAISQMEMSSHSIELCLQYCENLDDLLIIIYEQEMMFPHDDVAAAAAA